MVSLISQKEYAFTFHRDPVRYLNEQLTWLNCRILWLDDGLRGLDRKGPFRQVLSRE
jgi:hypothetical protein